MNELSIPPNALLNTSTAYPFWSPAPLEGEYNPLVFRINCSQAGDRREVLAGC